MSPITEKSWKNSGKKESRPVIYKNVGHSSVMRDMRLEMSENTGFPHVLRDVVFNVYSHKKSIHKHKQDEPAVRHARSDTTSDGVSL